MTLTDNIVSVAKSYIGQEEIRENQGFKDANFEKKMDSVGWYKSAPWCAFLAKLIWQEAFVTLDVKGEALVKKYGSGSALTSYHNYAESPEFHVSQTPTIGSLVIWKEGNGPAGHAGIVVGIPNATTVQTIEGNTNTDGSREGYIVAVKTRSSLPSTGKALNLVGFVHPIRIA
jgi:hypothetical protein